MILADKIINERKRNGWSQEELAEQLSVSRQSISKWEGAQAIPDIQKIIKMAELFGVSTDYLLKDEIEPEAVRGELVSSAEIPLDASLRRVSMEEASDYLKIEERIIPMIANAVSLCILSPILLIVLGGFSENPAFGISEGVAGVVGIVVLLLLVAAAVFFFIIGGTKLTPYEYLETKIIDTEYGVSGMVTERKKAYEGKHTIMIALGVIICILSVIPVIVATIMELPDHVIGVMIGLLLFLIAVGVNLLVRTGSIWESYQKLLQEGDYRVSEKRIRPTIRKISQIYWCVATAIYLGWSFLTSSWGISWVVWPVAGVLFAVVIAVVRVFLKAED